MELYFLGTGAGMPTLERNVTSIVLNLLTEIGAYWMFDCGEGTQHQLLRSPVKLSKLDKLFITHLHGDHIYGIPGLLSSRSHQGSLTPLTVYGPKGIREFIQTVLSVSETFLSYELNIHELREGTILDEGRFSVEAAMVEHRIDCYGFRIVEKDQPGALNVAKLAELGISSGPMYGLLKKGETVELANGLRLNGNDFLGEKKPGRKLSVIGDTRISKQTVGISQDVDVLVHEATFSEANHDRAGKYGHSTAADAAKVALESNVSALILTHYSSRYGPKDLDELLIEARAIFPNTYLANDHWSFHFPKSQR